MAKPEDTPEYMVHIVGHFCERHQELILIYQIEGKGLLAKAKLVATFPEGEEEVVANDIQRYEHDMFGQDIPTRIIPGIMGNEALQEIVEREVLNHTREADECVAKLMLGNLAGTLLDTTGGLASSYL